MLPAFARAGDEAGLSLERCLDIARQRHPGLASAKLAVDAQSAVVTQTRSAYYPQAAVSATAGRSQTDDLTASAITTTDSGSPLTATMNMVVYDFGKTGGKVGLSKKELDAARESLNLKRARVVLEAEEAYFEALRAHEAVIINGASLRMRKSFLPRIAKAYERGSRSKFDLSRAQTDYESSRLVQVAAEARLETARKRLLTAMGTPQAPWVALTDRLEATIAAPEEARAVEFALRRRAEARSARLQVEAESYRRRVAYSQHMPTLGISGGYALNRQFSEVQQRGNTWNVGVTASVDLFTGFNTQAGVAAASARHEAAAQDMIEVSQTVAFEVRSALIALREAQARIEAARRLALSAEGSLSLAVRQVERGSGGIFDLLDAQNQVLKGRLDLNDSLADQRVALARLERALGGTLAELDEG